jgi:glycosyltransferase involved in cell wall biosynthesis
VIAPIIPNAEFWFLPMKIVEITNVDFSLKHFLLPLMRELSAQGHEVIGISADGPLLADARQSGLRIVAMPLARSLSPLRQWRGFWALYRFFRAEKPDLVHAHMPISGFLARGAAYCAGVPRIAYTCHGFLFNQPGPLPRRALSLALEFIAGRITDVFLTVSAEEARDAKRWHIARAPIAVLNGRDPQKFAPDPAMRKTVRAKLNVAENRVVIIVVSRLVRHKGYPELLAAMRGLDAELWVVGDRLASDHGEDMEPYFAAAKTAGVQVKRLGYCRDVETYLQAADIFVLPSHFEGLPMSVIEAMLCGLPVIATDIRGPREQVVAGETGFLVQRATIAPLAASLKTLTGDAALRARLGAAGRARAVKIFSEAAVLRAACHALLPQDEAVNR